MRQIAYFLIHRKHRCLGFQKLTPKGSQVKAFTIEGVSTNDIAEENKAIRDHAAQHTPYICPTENIYSLGELKYKDQAYDLYFLDVSQIAKRNIESDIHWVKDSVITAATNDMLCLAAYTKFSSQQKW
jgi:hypothetical protein